MEVTSFNCVRMRSLSDSHCEKNGPKSEPAVIYISTVSQRTSNGPNLTKSPRFSPKIIPKNTAIKTPGSDTPQADPKSAP